MNKLKEFGSTILCVMLLTVSAYAGEIQLPGPPPPPNPPPVAASATEPGEIHIGSTQGSGFAGPAATEIALNLLQGLLLVF
jgi:hypothetical protein